MVAGASLFIYVTPSNLHSHKPEMLVHPSIDGYKRENLRKLYRLVGCSRIFQLRIHLIAKTRTNEITSINFAIIYGYRPGTCSVSTVPY